MRQISLAHLVEALNASVAPNDRGNVGRDAEARAVSRDITFNVKHENDLTGTFTAEPGQCILFTLPWDEGWTAYIDGKPVPIHKTWDLFMSIDAPEGQHTWEMKFFPAWMDYGLIISGIALLGLVVFMIVWTRRSKRRPAPSAQPESAEQAPESNIAAKAELSQ